ncbi:MAG TPA: hypothetical protein HPP97_07020 [Desulfuromonadales bacterium]|nr:hypothetical protein [Desulfuromonadales bacterium]
MKHAFTVEPAKSEIGQLFQDFCLAARNKPEGQRSHPFGYESDSTLDALSDLIDHDSIVAEHCVRMTEILKGGLAGTMTDEQAKDFKKRYATADAHAFPAVTEFLKHVHHIHGLTHNHSLGSIDLASLQALEQAAYDDPALNRFMADFRARLKQVTSKPDVKAYSQAFEIYSEAMVYSLLKVKFPATIRIDAKSGKIGSTPDFQCEWDGKVFYVEVKSLDIVDGECRHREMMEDGFQPNIQLEQQTNAGQRVASAVSVIAPYERYSENKNYDSASLITVINTLREKAGSAFKSPQFALGPTIALAVCDRLVIPGNRYCLAPYYYDSFQGGAIISGVWWQACFGTSGTPIFRHSDLEGKPTLEGHLQSPGMFADETKSFPGIALIAVELRKNGDNIFGLFDERQSANGDWSADDTEAVLANFCTSYNDRGNYQAHLLSEYQP